MKHMAQALKTTWVTPEMCGILVRDTGLQLNTRVEVALAASEENRQSMETILWNRSGLQTNADVWAAKEAGRSTVSCGNGLYVQFKKNGKIYFYYRSVVLGEKKYYAIGAFPHVCIEEAKHKALQLREKDNLLRKDSQEKKIISSVEKERNFIPDHPFESLFSTRKFFTAIEKSSISNNEKKAIEFLLLIPYPPQTLLAIKWKDVDLVGEALKLPALALTILLPTQAMDILRGARASTEHRIIASDSAQNSFIFHQCSEPSDSLSFNPAPFRTVQLNRSICDRLHYPEIRVENFRHHFLSIAIKASPFRPSFVKRTLRPQYVITSLSPHLERGNQRRLLSWWADAIAGSPY